MNQNADQCRRSLEVYHDVAADLEHIIHFSDWIIENYYDRSRLPIEDYKGRPIFFQPEFRDSLLIRYRRCFDAGKRGRIMFDKGYASLAERQPVHDELREMANKLVAHPDSAASSTQVNLGPHGSYSVGIIRPGVNIHDFKKLAVMSRLWLAHVQAEIPILAEQLAAANPAPDPNSDTFTMAPWGSGHNIPAKRSKDRKPRKNNTDSGEDPA